jgi:two-component system cell cycle sensor histidine kinase/response regulator CckA
VIVSPVYMQTLELRREPVLRAMLAASPLPMLVSAAEGDFGLLAINQRFARLFGYAADTLVAGDSWWTLAYPDAEYRRRVALAWRAAIRSAASMGHEPVAPIDARVTCSDGTLRDVEFYVGVHEGCAFAFCNDVTARRRAEAELSEARGFLQRVVDSSPSMIFVADERGRVVFANRAIANYYQMPHDLIVSQATEDLHTDSDEAKAFVDDDLEVIRTGMEIVKEERNTAPDGSEHWFHTVKVPLVRPDGRVQCLGIATDITERKNAEDARRRLEAQVWQNQKLESLGVLAGGIAHDFNNLLAAIRMNVELGATRLPASSPARPFLDGIELATHRAARLTQQMLAYVGGGHISIQHLRLDALVNEMKSLLDAVVSKKASFRLELAPAPVEADAAQLHQVVTNLLTNASDALGSSPGQIVIRTGVRELGREALRSAYLDDPPPPGHYAFLEVEDDGCGMAPETLARIFEPFFTTKFTGRGLGLSALLGIVRAHRGTLHVDSSPGLGTRFVVLLPHASGVALGEASNPLAVPRESRRVLLVIDDEDLVRSTLCIMLEDAGFRVLSAADGQEGLDTFERHRREIDAVVLDATMPRMDGWQCLKQLRFVRDDIPVLLMSGRAAPPSTPALEPALAFVQKPFDPGVFLQEVRRLIARRDEPRGPSGP